MDIKWRVQRQINEDNSKLVNNSKNEKEKTKAVGLKTLN